jgi:hypothetical protein
LQVIKDNWFLGVLSCHKLRPKDLFCWLGLQQ